MREEAGRANSTPDSSRAQPSPTPATNLAVSIAMPRQESSGFPSANLYIQ
jgi:hypothetical protein